MSYDDSNIFAKIIRGEIPCDKIFESDHSLAFRDINPQAPTHVLVIPKGHYVSFDDVSSKASAEEITDFTRAIGEVARLCGVTDAGYRILSNIGQNGHQEVPHLHVHLFGGRTLGPMLRRLRD